MAQNSALPRVSCQKLFYNEHTVVDSTYATEKDIPLGNN